MTKLAGKTQQTTPLVFQAASCPVDPCVLPVLLTGNPSVRQPHTELIPSEHEQVITKLLHTNPYPVGLHS